MLIIKLKYFLNTAIRDQEYEVKINYIKRSDQKICIQDLALPKTDRQNRMEKITNFPERKNAHFQIEVITK